MAFKVEVSIIRKVWGVLTAAQRHRAAVLFVLMLLGMLLETLSIGLMIPAIALFTQSSSTGGHQFFQPLFALIGAHSQRSLILGGMLVLVGAYLIKAVFLAWLAWWQMSFAYGVQVQLSQRLFTVYLRQPYTFHLQRNSAQLIRNVINEVGMFLGGVILPGISLLTESMVLFGLCILLIVIEPMGALIVLTTLSLAAWGFHSFTRGRIARWGQERQHHEGLRIQHLQQGLGGAKDVKLLGREGNFLEQYGVHNARSARVGQLQSTLQSLPRLWLELLAVSGLAALVISMLSQGRALEAVLPTLGMFATAAFRLMPSVNKVLNAVQALRYGMPVIDLLHSELQLAAPDAQSARGAIVPFSKTLELRGIVYNYPGGARPALNDVSLSIGRGESVGFIGASGAGKSTLVDILLGLLTPDAGEVRVDGGDIHQDPRNWQDQIGYVPQSIFLTDDTLRRNVAFGLSNENIDDAAVLRAIRAAQLEEFVAELPDGLETLVGERGIRLSGGQRQRIGIARALYHDPPVLVLDEATSSLDAATERGVMQAVTVLRGSKTILIVAHRLSTVADCDRLYRLEQGRVVAEGSPQEMLAAEKAAAPHGP